MSCAGALTHFSCKLGLKKKFFTALRGEVHPLHPLATPMDYGDRCQFWPRDKDGGQIVLFAVVNQSRTALEVHGFIF